MTQVSLCLNMCCYIWTLVCAVNNVKSSDQKSKDRLADTKIQADKVEERFALITGPEILIFRASPGKYKNIIPHRPVTPSYSLFHSSCPPCWFILSLRLCGAEQHLCHFYHGIFAYLPSTSFLNSFAEGLQTPAQSRCVTVWREVLRLVYKSLNGLAPSHITDLLV